MASLVFEEGEGGVVQPGLPDLVVEVADLLDEALGAGLVAAGQNLRKMSSYVRLSETRLI